MRGLQGRTFIVTGAASGIGRATTSRLLEEGAHVMGADIASAPELGFGSEGRDGQWAFSEVDVTDEGSVEALVRATVNVRGRRRRTGQCCRRGRRRAGAHAADR